MPSIITQYRSQPLRLAMSPWTSLSEDVKEAVRQQYARTCQYCSVDGADHVDHIFPQCLGGTHDLENLTLACERCNLRKGAVQLPLMFFAIVSARAIEVAPKIIERVERMQRERLEKQARGEARIVFLANLDLVAAELAKGRTALMVYNEHPDKFDGKISYTHFVRCIRQAQGSGAIPPGKLVGSAPKDWGMGRVAFFRVIDEIKRQLRTGITIKDVYSLHKEALGIGYPSFCKLVSRYAGDAKMVPVQAASNASQFDEDEAPTFALATMVKRPSISKKD